jgi:hypothetical protein
MIPVALALTLAFQDVDVRLSASRPRIRGSMVFDEKPALGNRVEFDPDPEAVPALEVSLRWPGFWMVLEARKIELSGRETFGRSRRWNESLFAAGEVVDIKLDWTRMRVGLEWPAVEEGPWSFAAGFAIRYDLLRTVLESAVQGEDDDTIGAVTLEAVLRPRWRLGPSLATEGVVRFSRLKGFEDVQRSGTAAFALTWEPAVGVGFTLGFEAEVFSVTKNTSLERNHLRYSAVTPMAGLALRF